MREWTSPGNIRKLTPSSAITPGNEMVMFVASTMGTEAAILAVRFLFFELLM